MENESKNMSEQQETPVTKSKKKVWLIGLVVVCIAAIAFVWQTAYASNLDGRWESLEYEQTMDGAFDNLFAQLALSNVQLNKEDYYHGGSSAIVINGNDVKYETRLNFDLEEFANAVYKQSKDLGSPEEIMQNYFLSSPNMVYDKEERALKQNIFEGKLDKSNGRIMLTEKNHRGLNGVTEMTYKVMGHTLTVEAKGFSHDFVRK